MPHRHLLTYWKNAELELGGPRAGHPRAGHSRTGHSRTGHPRAGDAELELGGPRNLKIDYRRGVFFVRSQPQFS